ncbi:MAG: tyrosine-type recombinase/integrase [Eggerthellaceae bacterium]|nr:tyrosine-type recombinase/integrase [Eggerthellaceae bacterium]
MPSVRQRVDVGPESQIKEKPHGDVDYHIKANITVGEYARLWHADRRDSGELIPSSYDREELLIRKIEKSDLALIELDDITEEDIDAFKRGNRKESKSEQSRLLNKVKQILKYAESRRRIKYDPSRTVKGVKENRAPRRSLTIEQQHNLLVALNEEEKDGKRAAIMIALATGLRLGEVLGLVWADFDDKKQTLTVERQLGRKKEIKPPKYNSKGVLPLDENTFVWLYEWRQDTYSQMAEQALSQNDTSSSDEEQIKQLLDEVTMRVTKTPICCNGSFEYHLQSNFSRWYRQYMAEHGFGTQSYEKTKDEKGYPRYHRTGYDGPKFHELRHTVASELVGSGVDLQTVKTLMRHSRITTTEQYLHEIPENLSAAVEKVARKRQEWDEEAEKAEQKTDFQTMNGSVVVFNRR